MRLPAGGSAGMAGMAVAVIGDNKGCWLKRGAESRLDTGGAWGGDGVGHGIRMGRRKVGCKFRQAARLRAESPFAKPAKHRTYDGMKSRTTRTRAFAPDPEAPRTTCEMPGCLHDAAYRAPRSREALNQYRWFCLDHVRAYNASWDFYKGMTPGQIEAQLRADTSWQRPTWPLGSLGTAAFDSARLHDPFDLMSATSAARPRAPDRTEPPATLRQPLATLGLDWPVAVEVLKTRYKDLAKKHHPDANGGDRAAEERLKVINLAYSAVRNHLVAEAALHPAG